MNELLTPSRSGDILKLLKFELVIFLKKKTKDPALNKGLKLKVVDEYKNNVLFTYFKQPYKQPWPWISKNPLINSRPDPKIGVAYICKWKNCSN